MKRELNYFNIGTAYGGCQEWFLDPMMRLGGCAAVTACDSYIYFDTYMGTHLYPFDLTHLTKKDYIRFGMQMKPYLRPRWSGIDTLELFIEGFGMYLSDCGCRSLQMEPLHGTHSVETARKVLIQQIDADIPVPCLLLNHRSPTLKSYEWHWFLLTGYEIFEDICMAKAVTYGTWQWLDLRELWNTGYQRKVGLILYQTTSE